MKYGIDVSDHQGEIDWRKVKEAGVQFAIIRTTRQTGQADTYLNANIKGCEANGIPKEFYKYSYAMNVTEARAEAQRVIEVLQGLGIRAEAGTRIWLDMEYDKQLALGKKKCMAIIEAYREEITRAGCSFGLYMGYYAYQNKIDASALSVDVWLARYPDTSVRSLKKVPDKKYKPVAKGGSTLFGWQFSSKGRIDGISGDVDLDVAYGAVKETNARDEYYEKPVFTLIESLDKIGVDSSYGNRARIAKKNGITNYAGTKEQNEYLLSLLNGGKLVKLD